MIELKYWRDLPKDKKQDLMKMHNIKAVSFDFIKKLYLESL